MDRVIVIVGPTAVGKTALSLDVAEVVGGEVVSADSRQVYRGLDLGTGKIRPEEMRDIPHHLLDVADPRRVFTAHDYVRLGTEALRDIHTRGRTPVVVGGTGLYVDALLGRMPLAQVEPNEELREQLAGCSLQQLQEQLQHLDPRRYETIDAKNPRRLIRAIEIASAGKPRDTQYGIRNTQYATLWIGLTLPKEELRERIRARILARLEAGMLNEARKLHAQGLTYERMEQLGLEYRLMACHLQGTLSYDDMIYHMEKEIVAYAKRQMTWFKKNSDIQWFSPHDKEKIISVVHSFLEGSIV